MRPRTQKNLAVKAKDNPTEDRLSRGQGQGPRTQAQVLSKKKGFQKNKKKVFTKIFQAISRKKRFHKLLTTHKIVLSSSRGQANFQGLEASRPIDLRGSGQGLQYVSSRPRTSLRTPPLVFIYWY